MIKGSSYMNPLSMKIKGQALAKVLWQAKAGLFPCERKKICLAGTSCVQGTMEGGKIREVAMIYIVEEWLSVLMANILLNVLM